MEFECGNMTSFGCKRMDGVKELIMMEIKEEIEDMKEQDEARRQELIVMVQQEKICKNVCCYGCEKANSCVYTCNRVYWPDEERKIKYNDEELRQEKLLGIKCYNCEKEINQEGHKANIRSDVTDCVWLCDDCFKRACGDQSKFEDLAKELKEKLSPIEYAVTQENATERPFTGVKTLKVMMEYTGIVLPMKIEQIIIKTGIMS